MNLVTSIVESIYLLRCANCNLFVKPAFLLVIFIVGCTNESHKIHNPDDDITSVSRLLDQFVLDLSEAESEILRQTKSTYEITNVVSGGFGFFTNSFESDPNRSEVVVNGRQLGVVGRIKIDSISSTSLKTLGSIASDWQMAVSRDTLQIDISNTWSDECTIGSGCNVNLNVNIIDDSFSGNIKWNSDDITVITIYKSTVDQSISCTHEFNGASRSCLPPTATLLHEYFQEVAEFSHSKFNFFENAFLIATGQMYQSITSVAGTPITHYSEKDRNSLFKERGQVLDQTYLAKVKIRIYDDVVEVFFRNFEGEDIQPFYFSCMRFTLNQINGVNQDSIEIRVDDVVANGIFFGCHPDVSESFARANLAEPELVALSLSIGFSDCRSCSDQYRFANVQYSFETRGNIDRAFDDIGYVRKVETDFEDVLVIFEPYSTP